jgi:hypothetical protein
VAVAAGGGGRGVTSVAWWSQGLHGLHVHVYGDLTNGCTSCGAPPHTRVPHVVYWLLTARVHWGVGTCARRRPLQPVLQVARRADGRGTACGRPGCDMLCVCVCVCACVRVHVSVRARTCVWVVRVCGRRAVSVPVKQDVSRNVRSVLYLCVFIFVRVCVW